MVNSSPSKELLTELTGYFEKSRFSTKVSNDRQTVSMGFAIFTWHPTARAIPGLLTYRKNILAKILRDWKTTQKKFSVEEGLGWKVPHPIRAWPKSDLGFHAIVIPHREVLVSTKRYYNASLKRVASWRRAAGSYDRLRFRNCCQRSSSRDGRSPQYCTGTKICSMKLAQ